MSDRYDDAAREFVEGHGIAQGGEWGVELSVALATLLRTQGAECEQKRGQAIQEVLNLQQKLDDAVKRAEQAELELMAQDKDGGLWVTWRDRAIVAEQKLADALALLDAVAISSPAAVPPVEPLWVCNKCGYVGREGPLHARCSYGAYPAPPVQPK